jgi:cytochrome c5
MRAVRPAGLSFLLLIAVLAAACGESAAPGSESSPAPAGSAPASAPAPAAEPATVAEIFPPGPGRDQLMNSCSSCHNLACSAIGQRTTDRWAALKESHADKIAKADLDAIFGYLTANFNDTKPAPNVPPRFLEGGCTPF